MIAKMCVKLINATYAAGELLSLLPTPVSNCIYNQSNVIESR